MKSGAKGSYVHKTNGRKGILICFFFLEPHKKNGRKGIGGSAMPGQGAGMCFRSGVDAEKFSAVGTSEQSLPSLGLGRQCSEAIAAHWASATGVKSSPKSKARTPTGGKKKSDLKVMQMIEDEMLYEDIVYRSFGGRLAGDVLQCRAFRKVWLGCVGGRPNSWI